MKTLIWLSIIVAALASLIAVISTLGGIPIPLGITSRGLLVFAGVMLLFGVNFGLLALLKK